jgi:hypothetical protein
VATEAKRSLSFSIPSSCTRAGASLIQRLLFLRVSTGQDINGTRERASGGNVRRERRERCHLSHRGKAVTLTNGIAEVGVAPGSAPRVTTPYFGNEAIGDLNGDGLPDTGFVLTQSSGGSGTFCYAVWR